MATLVVGVEIPDDQLSGLVRTGFARIPELLDDAGVGYVVLGADRDAPAGASLSPVLAGTVFARRTHGLGIVTAASPQRDHPYNIARRTASLDHIAGGRAGWLALRADHGNALGAPGYGTWAPATAQPGPHILAEAVTAARALWRTWPIESLTADVSDRPAYTEVRYADHTGVFPTTGPLNVPTTPQGEPIVLWNYRRGDGEHSASADIVVVEARENDAAAAELPATVTTHLRLDGRDPELPSRIQHSAAGGSVSGVLIRLDLAELPGFVGKTLPALSDAGLIRRRAGEPTLRAYLGIPRRPGPALERLRPVFAPA